MVVVLSENEGLSLVVWLSLFPKMRVSAWLSGCMVVWFYFSGLPAGRSGAAKGNHISYGTTNIGYGTTNADAGVGIGLKGGFRNLTKKGN